MRVRHLLFVPLVVSLVACSTGPVATVTEAGPSSGTSAAVTPTPTPTPTPSLTPTPTSPPASAPAETTPAPHVWVFGDEWDYTGADGAQGSGCSPGSTTLSDGVWFGLAHSWSTASISLDLACWYSGTTAELVAAARGDEVNNDYYLVNDVTTLRPVPVGGDVPSKKAGWEDGVFPLSAVMADPGGTLPTNHPYPVWIYISGGVATAVVVQFIP